MDYTSPVAKRTRSRIALMYREIHEKIKRQRQEKIEILSASHSESSFKVGIKVDEKANGSEKLGSSCPADSESIASKKEVYVELLGGDVGDNASFVGSEDLGKETNEVHVDVLVGDGGDNTSFVGMEDLGKETNKSSQKGIEGTDKMAPIMIHDSDDNDVCLSEGSNLGAPADDEELIYIHNDDDDVFRGKGLEESGGPSGVNVDDGGTKGVGVSSDKILNEILSSGLVCDGKGSGEMGRDISGIRFWETSEDDCDSDNNGDASVEDSDESEMSTSEEDNDHSSDEDYGVEKSESSAFLEDMDSSSEEEQESYIGKSVVKKKASDKENCGSEILVDSDYSENNEVDEEDNVINNVKQVVNSVAQRTRSQCAKNKTNHGTLMDPPEVDQLKLDVPTVEDDDDNEDDDEEKHHRIRKAVAKRSTARNQVLKYHDVQKILVNSILGMEELSLEDSLSPGSELDCSSGLEDPTPKKSEYEEEMVKLWAEMEFALASWEIHSNNSVPLENGATPDQEVENQAAGCCGGKHELIFDEEIGIMCKSCSFVKLETRYIAPSFCKRGWERSQRDFTILDNSILDELNNHNPGSEPQTASDSYSPEGTVWDIIPGIKNDMYPHQREGFEFIWSKLAGGIKLDKLKKQSSSNAGGGCIISHAPGTGKSRLTLVFLQSFMKRYPECKPVIVAPRSMLLTWEEEFRKWKIGIPFHNLNRPELSGQEDRYAVSLMNKALERCGKRKEKLVRAVKLYSWAKARNRSILGISYRLFAQQVGIDKRTGKLSKEVDGGVRKILLECPGLFVFDEGHTPRNHESGIFKALSNIKTDRRIILSGTPFQNNFEELFNILCLVAPKFAETIPSGNQIKDKKRGRKINEAKGKWASLTSSIGKVGGGGCAVEHKNLRELRTMISSIVHIHKGEVLKESLPGLRHFTVVVKPDEFQKSILEGVQRSFLREEGGYSANKSLLCLDHVVSSISVHPSLLPKQFYDKDEFAADRAKLDWLRKNPAAGVKTNFFMMLLKLSIAMDEKVLVFGQYLEPLNLITEQLKSCLNWSERKEFLYMDGKRDVKERQSAIKIFNDPKSEAKVLLASTRACGEGINLVGASRVVLLDVTWNPSVERQAISRAYRLGQKKNVYVYHLISSGTMEQEKCSRQVLKDRCSKLVFSSSDPGNQQRVTAGELDDKILKEIMQRDGLIEEIIAEPDESKLIETFGMQQ